MSRTVYLDSDFKCHVSQNETGTLTPYETDFFDDKCDAFIEGYRVVPEGLGWTREDGVVFAGEMTAPWKDYSELDSVQREYEKGKLTDAENALAILLGGETA